LETSFCNQFYFGTEDLLLFDIEQPHPVEFQNQGDQNIFGGDFTLFDNFEFEKSLFDDPTITPHTSPSSSTTAGSHSPLELTPSSPSSANTERQFDLDEFTISTLLTDGTPTLSTSFTSVAITTTPNNTTTHPRQICTPSVSGSEEPYSDFETAPSSKESNVFSGSYQ
jgi:hypothetical protein